MYHTVVFLWRLRLFFYPTDRVAGSGKEVFCFLYIEEPLKQAILLTFRSSLCSCFGLHNHRRRGALHSSHVVQYGQTMVNCRSYLWRVFIAMSLSPKISSRGCLLVDDRPQALLNRINAPAFSNRLLEPAVLVVQDSFANQMLVLEHFLRHFLRV